MTTDRYVDEATALVFVAPDGRVLDRFEPGARYGLRSNYFDAFRLLAAVEREDLAAGDRILRTAEALPLLHGVVGIALTLAKQALGETVADVFDAMAEWDFDEDPARVFRALGEQDPTA